MSENSLIFQSLDDLSNEILYRLNHNPMLGIRREKIEYFYSKFQLLRDYRLLRFQAAKLYSCIMQYCECILMFVQDNLISLKKNEVDYLKRWLSVLDNLAGADSIKNKLTLFMPLVQNLICEDFPLWIAKEYMLHLNLIFEKPTQITFGSKENKLFLCTVEKILKLIMICGDYELQTILMETIISTCELCHIEEVLARNFGDTNDLTRMFLQVYSKQNYINDLKTFLTAINDNFDYVCSVPCLNVTFEETVLPPIKGINGDDTWMHVNFGFRTFSFGCLNQFITVDFENIDKICLLMNNDSETLGKFLINLTGKDPCRFDLGYEFISSTKFIMLTMSDGSHLQFLRKTFIILFGARFKETNKFPIEKRNLVKEQKDLSVKGDPKKKNTIHDLENYCMSPNTTNEFMNNSETNVTNKSSNARKGSGACGTSKESLDINNATTSINKEMPGSCKISLAVPTTEEITNLSTFKFGEDNSLTILEENKSSFLCFLNEELNSIPDLQSSLGVIYKKEHTRNDDFLMLDNQESENYLFSSDFTWSTENDQVSRVLDFLDNNESITTPNMGNKSGRSFKASSFKELSQKNTTERYEECGNIITQITTLSTTEEQARNADISNISMSSMIDIDFDASTVVNVQVDKKCVALWNDLQERKNEETRLNAEFDLIMQKFNEHEQKDMETIELTHNSKSNEACRKKCDTSKKKQTKEQITSQPEKCNGNVEKYFQNFSKQIKTELFDVSDEETNYFETLDKPLKDLPTKRLLLNNFNTSQSKSTLLTLKTNKFMETDFEMSMAKNKLNSQELTLSSKVTPFDRISASENKNVSMLICELQKSPLNKSAAKVKVQNKNMSDGQEFSKKRLSDKTVTSNVEKRVKLAEDVRLSRKVHKSKEDNFAKFSLETSPLQFNEFRKSTLVQKMRKFEVCNLEMIETENRESDLSRKLEVFESIPSLEPVEVKKVFKEVQSAGRNQNSNKYGFEKLEAINEELFGLITKQQSTVSGNELNKNIEFDFDDIKMENSIGEPYKLYEEKNTTTKGIRNQDQCNRNDDFDATLNALKAYLETVKKPVERKKKPRKRRIIKMKYKKARSKSEKKHLSNFSLKI